MPVYMKWGEHIVGESAAVSKEMDRTTVLLAQDTVLGSSPFDAYGSDAPSGTGASSTSHTVTLTLVDWTSPYADEPAKASAFDAYSADAHPGGANVAPGDGSVRFLLDHVHTHDPLPVLMVIADGHY
jgi:prepilin-type processing-associated H-X9-DG protein